MNLLRHSNAHLDGLGGWLLVVALGLFVTFVSTSFSAYQTAATFSDGSVASLTDPSGAIYVLGYSAAVRFEILALGLISLSSAYCIILFFLRSPWFPHCYVAMTLAALIYSIVDYAVTSWLAASHPAVSEVLSSSMAERMNQLPGAVVSGLIWSTYMYRSERVSITFRREPTEPDVSY